MRRRQFIKVLAGSAAAWPLVARAQQSAMPVIGFLRSTSAAGSEHLVAAFEQGLKEAGFVAGQNVAIDYRWGNDQSDRLSGLAADLIHRQPAVIIGNMLATRASMAATTTIPLVFVGGSDPVRTGLVASVNHPGGNITGVVFTSADLVAKRLGLLHDLVPKSVAIAALFHPASPGAEFQMEEVEKAGQTIGRQVLIVKLPTSANSRPPLRRWSNKVRAGCSSAAVHTSSPDVDSSLRWRLATRCLRSVPIAASPRPASS
jgi:putative ABC transport system substrate-binding protein